MAKSKHYLFTYEVMTLCLFSMLFGACDLASILPKESKKSSPAKKKDTLTQSTEIRNISVGKLSSIQVKSLGLQTATDLGQAQAAWFLEDEQENRHCQSTQICQQSGRCTQVSLRALNRPQANSLIESKCVAIDRKSCLKSQECLKRGQCTPVNGACRVKSNLDCFQSQRCRNYGLCNADQGSCVAKSDQDCQNSMACQDFKACSFKAGLCVNKEDTLKECAYGCVRSEQSCFCHPDPPKISLPKSVEPACLTQCRKEGKCALSDQGCTPRNQTDCESSELCKSEGFCEYQAGRCIKSSAGCARSLQCTLVGHCILINQDCVASSVEDCLGSRACAEREACQFKAHSSERSLTNATQPTQQDPSSLGEMNHLDHGLDLDSIKQSGDCIRTATIKNCEQECRRFGQCELIDDRCLATSRRQCLQSDNCAKYGRCSSRNGRCSALSVQDCKQGLNCKRFGYCRPHKGSCVQ